MDTRLRIVCFLTPWLLTAACCYALIPGLINGEIYALKSRGPLVLITAADRPVAYWVYVAIYAVLLSFYGLLAIYETWDLVKSFWRGRRTAE